MSGVSIASKPDKHWVAQHAGGFSYVPFFIKTYVGPTELIEAKKHIGHCYINMFLFRFDLLLLLHIFICKMFENIA